MGEQPPILTRFQKAGYYMENNNTGSLLNTTYKDGFQIKILQN